MGTAFINGAGFYFWEFPGQQGRQSVGYFSEESIQSDIGRMTEIFRETIEKKPAKRTTEIAIVLSAESVWHQDVAYPAVVYENLVSRMVYEEFPGIGAPADIISINDLRLPEVRDQYKLLVFLNAFYLDTDQRRWVEMLKGSGRTLAFFYAPGYVDSQRGLGTESMSELTGIGIKLLEERQRPSYESGVMDSSPLLKGIPTSSEVNILPLSAGASLNVNSPVEIFPNFHVQDDAVQKVGLDREGRIRVAVKQHGDWNSFYSAVPFAPRKLLRNLAEWAGVHLYAPEGVVVEASENFLLIHHDGKRPKRVEIKLRAPAKVRALFSRRDIPVDAQSFSLNLPGVPFTEMYELYR
jgi:hypothetical protein